MPKDAIPLTDLETTYIIIRFELIRVLFNSPRLKTIKKTTKTSGSGDLDPVHIEPVRTLIFSRLLLDRFVCPCAPTSAHQPIKVGLHRGALNLAGIADFGTPKTS